MKRVKTDKMTCIISHKTDKNTIILASDSYIGDDSVVNVFSGSKWFPVYTAKNTTTWVGLAGYTLFRQYIQEEEIYSKNMLDFIHKVKTKFKKEKILSRLNDSKLEIMEDTDLLIVDKLDFYEVNSTFQINKYDEQYVCIGSGAQYSYGALFDSVSHEFNKKRVLNRINNALMAAEYKCNKIRRPYRYIEVDAIGNILDEGIIK